MRGPSSSIFMKTSKSQAILYLYSTLRDEGHLKKSEALEKLEITELTYRRYLSEIRCYFGNFDKGEEIVYDKKNDIYLYHKLG
jgi:hypothetical protein